MCGITGFWNTNKKPAELDLLKSMTDSIIHRGPDAGGYFIDGDLALGHRRL
jgi:asparagine synthase (glutamine-hydrolysing)